MVDHSRLIGKRLLVGITYRKPSGEFVRQAQYHGPIVQADELGIVIDRADGEGLMSLPPRVEEAEPLEYTLRSTGEVVCLQRSAIGGRCLARRHCGSCGGAVVFGSVSRRLGSRGR